MVVCDDTANCSCSSSFLDLDFVCGSRVLQNAEEGSNLFLKISVWKISSTGTGIEHYCRFLAPLFGCIYKRLVQLSVRNFKTFRRAKNTII